MNLDELRARVGLMTREQQLELMVKAGIRLRKALEDDKKRCNGAPMDAYLCPVSVIQEYDDIFSILSEGKGKSS